MNTTEIYIKDSARDDKGHGTQVAFIAAGNYVNEVSYFGYAKGTTVGVAPQTRLNIYKVSWNEGSVISDLCARIEQAVANNVDVINLSLAHEPELPFYEDVVAYAAFSAMEKGIMVMAATGNDGPHLATLQNGFPWVLTVTASTMDRWFAKSLVLRNAMMIFGWSMFLGDGELQNLPVVYDKNLSCITRKLEKDIPYGIIMCKPKFLQWQINLICRSNALEAILVQDHARIIGLQSFPCPCVIINQKQAKVVMSYVKNSVLPTVTINFKQTFTDIKPTPIMALKAFKGLSITFPSILKPDIIAPKSLVLAAWLPTKPIAKTRLGKDLYSNYKISYGTSNVAHHVAGVVTLLRATHLKRSLATITSAIITTTNTIDNTLNPLRDFNFELVSPLATGASQINPTQALDPGLVYDTTPQDFVDLLCSTFSEQQVFSITKHRCINPSSDLNYPSFISFPVFSKYTLIAHKFKRTVTNVGEGAAIYKATMVLLRHTIIEVSPKALVFQRKYEQQSYNMTITCKGDLDGIVSNGKLSWVDSTKKYRVRSPIVVMSWVPHI